MKQGKTSVLEHDNCRANIPSFGSRPRGGPDGESRSVSGTPGSKAWLFLFAEDLIHNQKTLRTEGSEGLQQLSVQRLLNDGLA